MRTIIAGSRTIFDYSLLERAIRDSGFVITALITNGDPGVSSLGYRWAYVSKIPIHSFKPSWTSIGKAAGHVNNFEMCANADQAVVVTDGADMMTRSLLEYCRKCQVKTYVVLNGVPSLITQGRSESEQLKQNANTIIQ